MTPALFDRFPALTRKVSVFPLLSGATPVRPLTELGKLLGIDSLWVKRDDACSPLYGGNKVRKLEFLLAEALELGHTEVMTFGFAGSNHCTATAVCAKAAGLKCHSILSPQENALYVRRNLLMGLWMGAELHPVPLEELDSYADSLAARRFCATGKVPYRIPAGGSSPTGVIGLVSAAFELAGQVHEGLLPEPDLLFVPMGTAGTAAGLQIGLRAADLKTQVVAVGVVDPSYMNAEKLNDLLCRTVGRLRVLDPAFPDAACAEPAVVIDFDSFGGAYAHITAEVREAMELMQATEGIRLEGTYTGKAVAALVRWARAGELSGKKVLYWYTLNSVPYPEEAMMADYHKLPKEFHWFFESAAQDD
ncbi:MAG: D-cysteine desulfhydrase [Planctomycetota bacterium]